MFQKLSRFLLHCTDHMHHVKIFKITTVNKASNVIKCMRWFMVEL